MSCSCEKRYQALLTFHTASNKMLAGAWERGYPLYWFMVMSCTHMYSSGYCAKCIEQCSVSNGITVCYPVEPLELHISVSVHCYGEFSVAKLWSWSHPRPWSLPSDNFHLEFCVGAHLGSGNKTTVILQVHAHGSGVGGAFHHFCIGYYTLQTVIKHYFLYLQFLHLLSVLNPLHSLDPTSPCVAVSLWMLQWIWE